MKILNIPVVKDGTKQRQIPTEWRKSISDIVLAFSEGDYRLTRGVPQVMPTTIETANQIKGYVKKYG